MFNFVALMSTRKTSVLISSLFFIADSVVTGHVMMRYLSFRPRVSTDFRGYFGSRFLMSVFGRKKCTFVLTFLTFRETAPFTAFATLAALSAPAAAFFGAIAAERGCEELMQ